METQNLTGVVVTPTAVTEVRRYMEENGAAENGAGKAV